MYDASVAFITGESHEYTQVYYYLIEMTTLDEHKHGKQIIGNTTSLSLRLIILVLLIPN